MKGETATEEVTPESGGQPEPETTTEAAGQNPPEETQPDQTDGETTKVTPDDPDATGTTETDDDVAWAQKKGIDLGDSNKVAGILRNADRKVSEAGRSKSQMQQEVGALPESDDADPIVRMEQRQQLMEAKLTAAEFYLDSPDNRQYDTEAATILNELKQSNPEYARNLAANLPDLFALARQRHDTNSVAKAKEEGRLEERRALASKQRASTVSPAATTHDTPQRDPFLDGFNAT